MTTAEECTRRFPEESTGALDDLAMELYESPVSYAEKMPMADAGESDTDHISNVHVHPDAHSPTGNRQTMAGNMYDSLPDRAPQLVQLPQEKTPDLFSTRPKKPDLPPLPELPSRHTKDKVPADKQAAVVPATENMPADLRCTTYEQLHVPDRPYINVPSTDTGSCSTPLPVRKPKKADKQQPKPSIKKIGRKKEYQPNGLKMKKLSTSEPRDVEKDGAGTDPVVTVSVLKRMLSFCIFFFILGLVVGAALTLTVMLTNFRFKDQTVVLGGSGPSPTVGQVTTNSPTHVTTTFTSSKSTGSTSERTTVYDSSRQTESVNDSSSVQYPSY